MKNLDVFMVILMLLFSLSASGQINPNDRPEWSQGFFLNFEETGEDTLNVLGFDCAGTPIFEKAANPAPNPYPNAMPGEIYNSANVGKITTTDCTWEGVYIEQEFVIDCSVRPLFQVDVYPPAADRIVMVKIEDYNDNSINIEVQATTTAANEWQTLTFDFSGTEAGKYGRIVLFMDFESTAVGEVWYFDNVRQTQPPITYDDGLIEDFENGARMYWGSWSCEEFFIDENPDPGGINTSATIGYFLTSTELWEGACTAEPVTAFDFSEGAVFKVKVFAPEEDRILMLKIENLYDKTDNPIEVQATTTTAYEWEELTFDFSEGLAALPESYQVGFYGRVAVFPDFWSDIAAEEWYVDDIVFEGKLTSVDQSHPVEYQLYAQNYPNPFNPSTTISYSIPTNAKVELTVFNTVGEEVGILVNEEKSAGSYTVHFDGSNLPSGVYLYNLKAGTHVLSQKMLLVK